MQFQFVAPTSLKLIMLVLQSVILSSFAWAGTITLNEDTRIRREGPGGLEIVSLLPKGTKIKIDETLLESVQKHPRGHQQVYLDSQGQRRFSKFPFVSGIQVEELPEDSGLNPESFRNPNYYVSLGSLLYAMNGSDNAQQYEERIHTLSLMSERHKADIREEYYNIPQVLKSLSTSSPQKTKAIAQRPQLDTTPTEDLSPPPTQAAKSPQKLAIESNDFSQFLARARNERLISAALDEELPQSQAEIDPETSMTLLPTEDDQSDTDLEQEEENEEDEMSPTQTVGKYPPICGCSNCVITSPHGTRCHPIKRRTMPCSNSKTQVFHDGNDWGAPTGTPVRAPCDGRVIYHGNNDPKGYGNQVVLHCQIEGRDYHFRFHHLHSFAKGIKSNPIVKAGDVVAKVGSTGGSTGPHLDIEIHRVRNPNQVVRGTTSQRMRHPNLIESIDPAVYFANLNSRDILKNASLGSPTRNITLYNQFNREVLQRSCPVRPGGGAGSIGPSTQEERTRN